MNAENESRRRAFVLRGRSAAVRLGASATIWIGLASLCGFLAHLAWPFELLCHFRVQYTLLFLAIGLAMGSLRAWRWAGVAALLMGINGWELLPYYVETGTSWDDQDFPAGLRIVSANLYSGNQTPEQAVVFLQESAADVIALYEVTPAWDVRLSESLPDYPHRWSQARSGNFGIAVYSRLPFEKVDSCALSEHNLAIRAEFLHAGGHVHLIAAHPCPPGGSRTDLRDRQLERLGAIAGACPGPLVVVGDLNITPFSPKFQLLCSVSGLRDARRGHGIQPTWPAGRRMLSIPIDHGLISEHWRGTMSTGPEIGSDHLPVVLEIGLSNVE